MLMVQNVQCERVVRANHPFTFEVLDPDHKGQAH